MNFKKHLGLTVMIAILPLYCGNADATYCNSFGRKAGPGQYCSNLVLWSCPTGCYCEGGGSTAFEHNAIVGRCRNHTQEGRLSSGMYLCPDGFTKSVDAASKKEQCYNENEFPDKIFNATRECKAGETLPSATEEKVKANAWDGMVCVSCKKEFENNSKYANAICPGGTFNIRISEDESRKYQGVEFCDKGQTPNEERTSCVNNKIKCDPGEYLPNTATACSTCKDGYKCVGGEFEIPAAKDLGIEKCDDGYKSNDKYTDCIANSSTETDTSTGDDSSSTPEDDSSSTPTVIPCKSGEYLPAGATVCTTCPEDSYCVGGNYNVSDTEDKGAIKCAPGMSSKPGSSKCETLVLECKPGEWVPAGKKECEACTGAQYFCPGGEFKYSDKPQGRLFCAFDGIVSADHSSCHMTITAEQMAYGPMGQSAALVNQCWIRMNAEAYRYCIFGDTFSEDLFDDISTRYYAEEE